MDLQTLSDRAEITDLLTRYARAVDRQDWDLFRSVFTPDARIDYTQVGGIAGDIEEVAGFLSRVMPMFEAIQHLVSNIDITIDGDEAKGCGHGLQPAEAARQPGVGHRRVVPPRAGAHPRRLAEPVTGGGGKLVPRHPPSPTSPPTMAPPSSAETQSAPRTP